jgi:hypothetical protein
LASLFEQRIVLRPILNDTLDLGQKADYSTGIDFELKDIEKVIAEAKYFLAQIRQVISLKRRANRLITIQDLRAK